MEIKIHDIATAGLPDMERLTGRVAFVFNGCIVSGWPLRDGGNGETAWEADSDVGRGGAFFGVTHWVEFPVPVWKMKANTALSRPGSADDQTKQTPGPGSA